MSVLNGMRVLAIMCVVLGHVGLHAYGCDQRTVRRVGRLASLPLEFSATSMLWTTALASLIFQSYVLLLGGFLAFYHC